MLVINYLEFSNQNMNIFVPLISFHFKSINLIATTIIFTIILIIGWETLPLHVPNISLINKLREQMLHKIIKTERSMNTRCFTTLVQL